ncbi:hypothetical protein MSPP1_001905 [Malassezia sp. CBS 17886]|nr:hypothetical protein MSPP1_001905 [Malassezia sp. CBS 17886]
MGRTRARPGKAGVSAVSEEQISEVLANYDLECEKQLARVERSANRYMEAARAHMEARKQRIPHDVRDISLQAYYDMHASSVAAERGRHVPPLAMASLPDAGL